MSTLRSNRPFRALIATTVANELSSAMGVVVVPLLILTISDSAAVAGIASFIAAFASICTQLLSGGVVDRWAPDRTLRLSSVVQAAAWGGLALWLLLSPVPVWAVIAAATLAGIASSLDGPSEHALVKLLVPQQHLGRAVAVSQGRESAAGLLGGPAGGALFGVAVALPVVAQTVLHTVAAIMAPRAPRERTATEPQHFWRDLVEGYRMVLAHRGLRGTAIVAGIANLPIVMLPLALLAYYRDHGVSPFQIGLFMSAFGIGIFVGAFGAAALTARMRLGVLGIVAITAFAAGQVAVLVTHESFWLSCAVLALSALPLPAFNAAIGAFTMAITPPERMGRVSAAVAVPGMILMPLGLLLGGVLYESVGIVLTLAASAAMACAAALVMLLSGELRRIPALENLGEGG